MPSSPAVALIAPITRILHFQTLHSNPAGRGVGRSAASPVWRAGSSSGAIAAFTVAWERPNDFRKVISIVGSFVNLRGGHVYPEKILATERKPIRIFLVDGVIVTSKFTGINPDTEDLIQAKSVTKLPVLIGSGMTAENIREYYYQKDSEVPRADKPDF